MKRRSPSDGRGLRNGYFDTCPKCGQVVVCARSTGQPFHMHFHSKKCRDAAAKKSKR